jgi:hypothetical protein
MMMKELNSVDGVESHSFQVSCGSKDEYAYYSICALAFQEPAVIVRLMKLPFNGAKRCIYSTNATR